MVAVIKKDNTYIAIKKLEKLNFIFPAKNAGLLFLFIREWLEAQDVFITIKKFDGLIQNKYTYDVKMGHRLYTATAANAKATAKEALETAILYTLEQDIFPKNK